MRQQQDSPTPVTVIGLGLMGQALAGAFLHAGHPTTGWNRTAAKAEPLVARGAVLAASARAAVAASPLVVVCVTDYGAVRELLGSLSDVLDGRTVVNLTSGTSQEARDTARWAAGHGAVYLDGAILAIPQAIGTAESLIVYSGPQPVFDRHETNLRGLGGEARYVGADPGLASLYDAAGLTLMWSILNGFLHGAALLGTADVPASTFASFAGLNIRTVAGWLPGYAQQVDDDVYPAPDATIDTHVAAMNHLLHESEALKVDPTLPRYFKELGDRAVTAGHGAEGYAAMIELLRGGSPAPA